MASEQIFHQTIRLVPEHRELKEKKVSLNIIYKSGSWENVKENSDL